MPRYNQLDDLRDREKQPSPFLPLALGIGSYMGLGALGGWEKGMRKAAAGATKEWAGYYATTAPIRKRLVSRGALTIADTMGVFTPQAFKAAGRAGLQSQFAKIALSRAAGFAVKSIMPTFYAQLAGSAVFATVRELNRFGRMGPKLEMGGRYIDTQAAYTERQRALRAITSSRMSTRAAIGGEAQLFHR